jgi:sugar lactone lactonase YvrE
MGSNFAIIEVVGNNRSRVPSKMGNLCMQLKHFAYLLYSTSLILAQPVSVVLNDSPSRVLGQPSRRVETLSPNWVEGRELTTPQGLAFDRSASSAILYVADTGNNRILAWRNPLSAANGAMADLVIGQRTRFNTAPNGPGTTLTTGLNSPTGVVVDREGNLWVADSNNNRILRYPKPFEQPADLLFPDVILGQESFGTSASAAVGRLPNRGRENPAANSLFLSDLSANIFRCRMVFDNAGNLWVTDGGNHRVLRFPARVLTPGNFGPDADLVLGQIDFVSRRSSTGDIRDKTQLNTPSGLALGADGRLYVSDGRGRVMVYRNPSAIGQNAERILGILVLQPGQPAPPRVNDTQLGIAEGLFINDGALMVVDSSNNRIVRYNPADSWAPESAAVFSPSMRDVLGQDSFNSREPNRAANGPIAGGFNTPVDAAILNNNLFVVDADNNRIIVFPGGPNFA